jgi:hypothetical protein
MSVELDKNLENKVIFKKRTPAGKSLRYLVVTCIGCNKQREVISWKWTSRSSDYCKSCFAKYVSSQSVNHITHGLSSHPLYTVYKNMINRCHDPSNHNYKYYGLKGISVCDKWRDQTKGLQTFFSWCMMNGWEKGLQLDRIDNNGNYEPNNVHYITQLENLKKMNNLFGVEGRKVKCNEIGLRKAKKNIKIKEQCVTSDHDDQNEVQKSELKIDAPDNLESYTKLDDYFSC